MRALLKRVLGVERNSSLIRKQIVRKTGAPKNTVLNHNVQLAYWEQFEHLKEDLRLLLASNAEGEYRLFVIRTMQLFWKAFSALEVSLTQFLTSTLTGLLYLSSRVVNMLWDFDVSTLLAWTVSLGIRPVPPAVSDPAHQITAVSSSFVPHSIDATTHSLR